MHRVNRISVIGLLLSGMIGSGLVLFFLVANPQEFINSIQNYLGAVAQVMINTTYSNRISFAVGMGGIIWLCLGFLLWLEFRPLARRTVRVSNMARENIEVDLDLVKQRLTYSLHRLSDVQRVEPVVQAKRNRIRVGLVVVVNPVVNIPMKSQEIQAMTRELLEQQMRLPVDQIDVSLLPGAGADDQPAIIQPETKAP